MKFLIDMNLSPLRTGAFGDRDIEAIHWRTVGDPGAPDRELMRWARTRGYVVFTHDLDFSRMLALTWAEGPSVLQLRSQAVLPDEAGPLIFAALRQHELRQHETLLELGALLVVDATTQERVSCRSSDLDRHIAGFARITAEP